MNEQLNEQQIRNIIKEEIRNSNSGSRFQQTATSRHVHNGLDSPPVSAVNLIYNTKASFQIIASNEETPFTVNTAVSNPTAVYASGIARTPVSGVATTKSSFFGIAQLGDCFSQTLESTQPFVNIVGEKLSFIQMCSGTQFAATGAGGGLSLTGSLSAGATSATLSFPWAGATTFEITTFSNGNVRTVFFTNASTSISWDEALTSSAASSISYGSVFTPSVYSNVYIAAAADPALASIAVTGFSNNSISFLATANSVWSITANFFVV